MSIFRVAFKNVKASVMMYRLYLLSMIFTVIIFFLFISLQDNPTIQMVNSNGIVNALVVITLVVMMFFVVFFLMFSNKFFINERKNEIGLYVLMGTTPGKIGLIVAIENMMMYFMSTLVGITIGTLFSKLFIMIIAKFLNIGITIDFHISFQAMSITFITFMILGILTSIRGYITIARKKIIHLLKGKSKEEKIPRGNIIVGGISLVVIWAGYCSSGKMNDVNLLLYGLAAIILVIIGTFLFYRSIMTMFFKLIMKNKKYIYKHNRLITFSSLWHRIGTNYKVYAAITIFLACTLTAFATSYSFYYGIGDVEKIKFPFTLSYTEEAPSELYQDIETFLDNQGENPLYSTEGFEYFKTPEVYIKGMNYSIGNAYVIRLEDYNKHIQNIGFKTGKNILYEKELGNQEVLFINSAEAIVTIGDVDSIILDNKEYTAKKSIKAPLFGEKTYETLVVNDQLFEELYLRSQEKYEDNKEYHFYFSGFKFKNEESFFKDYGDELKDIGKSYNVELQISVNAKDTDSQILFIRLFFILGVFLSLTFIMATGSIIYFKIISQATEDIVTYNLLWDMGMNSVDLNKTIYKQILMFFFYPLLLASIHSFFANMALERFMGVSLIVPMISSVVVVGCVFFVYFLMTIRKYKKIVL